MLEEKRTLLDLVSGGRYKTSRDMPSMLELGASYNDWVNKRSNEEIGLGLTNRDLYDIVVGSGGGIVKSASNAVKLFTGWRDNLSKYMLTAPKKERKMADYIVRQAMLKIDETDIAATQRVINSVNKEFGLAGKVVVPEIKGAAGGAMRQAAKKKGSQIQKQSKGEKWRKQYEKKTEIAAKKKATTGDEPYHRMTQKIQ